MTTCFLFTHHLNEDSCLSVRLDQKGQIEAPLAQRNFSEIKALQANSRTCIVAPGQHFSIHRLNLPWLADRKAREAIPFALEDRLAQNVDTLHFAFDSTHYQQGHYLIVVGDKKYLTDIITIFDDYTIHFDLLTIDWFALNEHEIALMDAALLVNDETFKGNLSADLVPFYLKNLNNERTIYCFADSDKSQLAATSAQIIEQNEPSYVWIGEQLLKTKPMNLCQGELAHGRGQEKTKRLYQAAFGMVLIWLLSFFIINGLALYTLSKDKAAVDEKIAVIYRQFFPQAQTIINPRFRISQLLKTKQSSTDRVFWTLLDKVAETSKESSTTIEQLRFQNQMLIITLATNSFSSLEDFQTALQKEKVNVKQTQASTRENQVVSTLELSL